MKTNKNNLFTLVYNLGISNKELQHILTTTPTEPPLITLGPRGYNGGFYGTISINDFSQP